MERDVTLSVSNRRAVLTIDRPATRNAIDRPTMGTLAELLDEVEALAGRDDVRVLAIRGGGDRVFVSGGDLKELATIRTEDDAREMALSMRTVLDRVASLPVPTVALLNGHAFGGGAEVAIACDMRLAADDVRIGFTQVQLGIMPAWGGVERLAKLLGRGRTCHLLLTGSVLTAEEAARTGLVEEVVARADFDVAADRLLTQLAALPAAAARGIRELVDQVWRPDSPATTKDATTAFARSWVSEEHWGAVEVQARLRAERRAGAGATG
jgi:enoyl-CoA hydratase/carnithine racemase